MLNTNGSAPAGDDVTAAASVSAAIPARAFKGMATATRPDSAGKFEIETGDDFVLADWLRIGTDITGQGPFNAAFVLNGVPVPGPIAGAGLPGLMAACGGLLAWWRRHRQTLEREQA